MELVCVSDYEKKAAELFAKAQWDFFRGGAGDELTLQLNCTAFDKIRIRPRVLIDVAKRDSSCNILGIDLDLPIAIAPTGTGKLAHSDAENATAKAAGKLNTIYTMSSVSTCSVEEVAIVAPNANKWLQLEWYANREALKTMIRRAEKSGFKAIVVTVDAQVDGIRYYGMRNKLMFPDYFQFPNLTDAKMTKKEEKEICTSESISEILDETLNWNDIDWLTKFTNLPVILKGILTHEDATLALNSGCKGIIVSNHGARQLDTVPATIEALPEIVKAVGSDLVVMLDGGIRNGTDVFKALALGAKCVFIGRPALFGLAVNGQQGVEHILEMLKKELDTTMALTGVKKLSEINGSYVAHESSYYKLSS